MFDRNVLKSIARNLNKEVEGSTVIEKGSDKNTAFEIRTNKKMPVEKEMCKNMAIEKGKEKAVDKQNELSISRAELEKMHPYEKICSDVNLCQVCIVRKDSTNFQRRKHETSLETPINIQKKKEQDCFIEKSSSIKGFREVRSDSRTTLTKNSSYKKETKQKNEGPGETIEVVDLSKERSTFRLVSDGNESKKKKIRHTARPAANENSKDWIGLFVEMESTNESEMSSFSREGKFKNSSTTNINQKKCSSEKQSLNNVILEKKQELPASETIKETIKEDLNKKKITKPMDFQDTLWQIPGQKYLNDDIEEESVEELSVEIKKTDTAIQNEFCNQNKKTLFLSNVRPAKKIHKEDASKRDTIHDSSEKLLTRTVLQEELSFSNNPGTAAKKLLEFKESNKHLFKNKPCEILSPNKPSGLVFIKRDTGFSNNQLIILSDQD